MAKEQREKINQVLKLGDKLLKEYGLSNYLFGINTKLNQSLGRCWGADRFLKPQIELSLEAAIYGSIEQIKYIILHEIVHGLGIHGVRNQYKKDPNYDTGSATESIHSKEFNLKMEEISGKTEKELDKLYEGITKPRYEYKCKECSHTFRYHNRIKKSYRSSTFYTCPKCESESIFIKDHKLVLEAM